MRRIDVLQDGTDILNSLFESSVGGVLERSDDAFAALRSFQSSFRQLHRSPEMIRIMCQPEFNFAGVVDATEMSEHEADAALKRDWFDSTFVVVDYANVEVWLARCLREAAEGRVVVALIPSRTNTQWFHELVLDGATEVRFIKGRVQFTGGTRTAGWPDALAVYRGYNRKQKRIAGEIAVLACARTFTDANKSFGGNLHDDNKKDL